MNSFILLLQFATRLPLPLKTNYSPKEIAKGVKYFPLVGLILGGIIYGFYRIAVNFLPPLPLGVILLVISIYLTGGLHLDGLADTADGLGSSRSREDTLAIMKDSRIGAMGVIALVSLLLLKFSLFASLQSAISLPMLLLPPVLGRWGMVWGMAVFPSGRQEGLGKAFAEFTGKWDLLLSMVFTLLIAFLVAGAWGIYLLLLAGGYACLFHRWITKRLGGITGDTLGAACETGEVFSMLLIFLYHHS